MVTPASPGEMLNSLFIVPRKHTIPFVAKQMDMPEKDLQNLIDGTLNVTDTILDKLTNYSGMTWGFWESLNDAHEEHKEWLNRRTKQKVWDFSFVLSSKDGHQLSEQEVDALYEVFIKHCEEVGMMASGGYVPATDTFPAQENGTIKENNVDAPLDKLAFGVYLIPFLTM